MTMTRRNGNAGLNLHVTLAEADLIRFALDHTTLTTFKDGDLRDGMVKVLSIIVPPPKFESTS